MILVTGFGPFPGVPDNPAERLARAVHGRRVGGETLLSVILPVSYARAPQVTLDLAERLGPRSILGIGVAPRRDRAWVERVARRRFQPVVPDVDDVRIPNLSAHGDEVLATADVDGLARRLGVGVSEDAGSYVCNAWLYEVAAAAPSPVAFLHIPPTGLEPSRLLSAFR